MQQPLRQVLDEFGNVPEEVCSTVEQTPGGRARGLFDPKAKDYRATMDVCAFNGSEWRARYDNPGPLARRGAPMAPAALEVSLSDGTTLSTNLLPALELFERER